MEQQFPRITFGIIVLNGEPFVRYNLRALYPFAHQIIVVEGAAPGAAGVASPEGHSTDGTLDTLHDFKANEDPEGKVTIVTAEDEGHPNGFWPGEKHEMSQAYAKRATGDYLWQVDVDEFYQPEDMHTVLEMLQDDPGITAMSFKQITFWGGFDYLTDGWYLRRGAAIYHRLFRWGAGYRYVTHRPPTVHDAQGRNLRDLHWVDGGTLADRGINLYHYSLLLPQQVLEKCAYYAQTAWAKREGARRWAEENFLQLENPYRVHNVYDYPSWLERFRGSHPPQIEAMRRDIAEGRLDVTMRDTEDVEQLLRSPAYRLGQAWLKVLDHWDRRWNGPWRDYRWRIRRLLSLPLRAARRGWRYVQRRQRGV
jgi:hypothetical protein